MPGAKRRIAEDGPIADIFLLAEVGLRLPCSSTQRNGINLERGLARPAAPRSWVNEAAQTSPHPDSPRCRPDRKADDQANRSQCFDEPKVQDFSAEPHGCDQRRQRHPQCEASNQFTISFAVLAGLITRVVIFRCARSTLRSSYNCASCILISINPAADLLQINARPQRLTLAGTCCLQARLVPLAAATHPRPF